MLQLFAGGNVEYWESHGRVPNVVIMAVGQGGEGVVRAQSCA